MMTAKRIKASDRFKAALHEAAHAAVARHHAVYGIAELVAGDVADALLEKTYVGRFTYGAANVTPGDQASNLRRWCRRNRSFQYRTARYA
jgi:hypothetical protein